MKKLASFLSALFGHALFLINLGMALWLIICWYAAHANPADIKYIGIVSLSTPFVLLGNFVFVLIWLFTKKKGRSLLSIIALIICHSLILPIFGMHIFEQNDMAPRINGLKIMSWNVHGLGLYDRPIDKKQPQKMFAFVEKQSPDIFCMLEFYTNVDGSNKEASKYFDKAGYKEYRFMYDNDLGAKIYIGNAVFSKYPLSNFEEIPIDNYIKMMSCDVSLPNDKKVRLFVVHLQSFLLADKDKAFIEEVKKDAEKLEHKKTYSKNVLAKMHNAYTKRAPQAILANAEIEKSPYPALLCADLNDVPCSYTYTTIKGNLCDAFEKKGRGMSQTYNKISPTLRIDYIFYNPEALSLLGYQSIATPQFSDHNPVIANFLIQ